MESIKIIRGPPKRIKEVEPIQPVQRKVDQTNTCRTELSWIHLYNDSKLEERQKVLAKHGKLPSISKEHLSAPAQTWQQYSSIPCKLYGTFIEINNKFERRKLYQTNQVTNILKSNFSNKDITFLLLLFLFNWNSLYARLNRHYNTWSYKKKKHKKIKAYRKSNWKEPTFKSVC